MRTIHRPVLPFWLTKSSEAWKNKGLQLKVPQHLPLQVHNLHSSRSQIPRSTNKEILCIIGGELWTFHPRNPKKFELTNGKFLPSWENLAFMGRWKSYWASVTLNQESSLYTKSWWNFFCGPPSQDSNWALSSSDILQSDFYNVEMVLFNSQTVQTGCTYN